MGSVDFVDLAICFGINLGISSLFLFLYSLLKVQPINARVYFTRWFILDDKVSATKCDVPCSIVRQGNVLQCPSCVGLYQRYSAPSATQSTSECLSRTTPKKTSNCNSDTVQHSTTLSSTVRHCSVQYSAGEQNTAWDKTEPHGLAPELGTQPASCLECLSGRPAVSQISSGNESTAG